MYKNDLSKKIQQLDEIDRDIWSLLKKGTVELYPHERRVFYTIGATIFSHTPTLRGERLIKANIIYQTHLTRIKNLTTYKRERIHMQR